jgi:flagellar biosynthesis/type III secretory pathway protein FliH
MSEFHQQLGVIEVWDFPTLEEASDPIECYLEQEITTPAEKLEEEVIPEDNAELVETLAKLNDKIQYVESLGTELRRTLAGLDENLLSNIILLIKKTVKKIILKELILDEDRLKAMINDSLAAINRHNEACVIYVSEDDFTMFDQETSLHHLDIRCDSSLSRGDFVIKTKLSELESILEQRLTTLFGL